MDRTELLFAAEVRRLAVDLQSSDWAQHSRDPDVLTRVRVAADNPRGAAEEKERWHADNPLSVYIERAYKLIYDTALQLQTYDR